MNATGIHGLADYRTHFAEARRYGLRLIWDVEEVAGGTLPAYQTTSHNAELVQIRYVAPRQIQASSIFWNPVLIC